MARKRKVEHETAVSDAIGFFWKFGYPNAGTRDMEEQIGLTRFTLQSTYGGKQGFFLEALDSYLDTAEARVFPDPATTDLEDLAVWFERLVAPERMPRIDDSGCLAFNSIRDFDRTNDEVNARVDRYLTGLECRFREILLRAEAANSATHAQSAEERAKLLISLLLGLHSMMKARSNDELPQAYGASAANLIRSWITKS